jgi:hypothetical protein
MDREIVLLILVQLFCGCSILFASSLSARHVKGANAEALERARWRELWTPLVPAALMCAALLGWVYVEPKRAEPISWPFMAGAVSFALVWLRAALRALLAFVRRDTDLPAATEGLLHPRTYWSPRFREEVDGPAFAAACAHEQAHQRHRDPLRLWLAQFATDLQWPNPAARRRFERWHEALELARDEEARRHGVDGADLAAAIVAAARLNANPAAYAEAALTGHGTALRQRISRLLAPLDDGERTRHRIWPLVLLVLTTLVLAWVGGVLYGERVIGGMLKGTA